VADSRVAEGLGEGPEGGFFLGQGTRVSGRCQRLYFMALPGGASRCLTARRPNLLLLSHLVPVVAVGVFCVIGLYFFLVCLCARTVGFLQTSVALAV